MKKARISLAPLKFEEALQDLLKVKPEKKRDRLEALDKAWERLNAEEHKPKRQRKK